MHVIAVAVVSLLMHAVIEGEVIGASGRIGSLLLRAGGGLLVPSIRGDPGALSPRGTPLYVATPASAVPGLLRAVPENRLGDLVLCPNGMMYEVATAVCGAAASAGMTIGVLYFGVLSCGAEPSTGSTAPASVAAGPHAARLAALLDRCSLRCDALPKAADANAAAGAKMMWSSSMWLLCAVHACCIDDVHAQHADQLAALVDELYAEVCASAAADRVLSDDVRLVAVETSLEQMRAYSSSMPGVVPSRELALEELTERNGWFVRRARTAGRSQPTHEALLRQVGCWEAAVGNSPASD